MYYKDRKDYYIYIHISPNNKYYVGYSCQKKPEYRWRNGYGYCKNPLMWNAIQKYGWNNFKHLILKTNLSFDEANEFEKYYIKLYKSNDREFGYNLTEGSSNPNMTPEAIEKIRLKKLGTRRYNSKIFAYNEDGKLLTICGSYKHAEEVFGINLYRISSCCLDKGVIKIPKRICFSKEELNIEEIKRRFDKADNIGKKYVYQYDLKTGQFIAQYRSNIDAAKGSGMSEDTICISCSDNENKDMAKAYPKGFLFRHNKLTEEELQKYIKLYTDRETQKIKNRRNQYSYEKCKNQNTEPGSN